ncbi:Abi family protein [Bacillus spizizenii]|nr:Abi family protein [Bacillus spizizenii]
MRPFKTYRQQIAILRSRKLVIPNGSRALRILESENYYNVINGYKNLFLARDASNSLKVPEEYKPGATLDEIYYLFTLDRELRNILLKYLLIFENSIKSKISYHFSKTHKEEHAYLQLKNYSKDADKLERILNLITKLAQQISHSAKKNSPIKHYLDHHDSVPLWVLVNYLSLGIMSNFYICLTQTIQDQICKEYSKQFKKDYGSTYQVTSDTIAGVLKSANLFRNVCAHEERLYNYKITKSPKSAHAAKLLSIPQHLLNGSLFSMVAFLKIVLTKKDFKTLVKTLDDLFATYNSKFSTITFPQILAEMGFPTDWRRQLNV